VATKVLTASRLKKIIAGFKKSSILVVGDCMVDKYIWGDVRRISPEAPVPVVQVENQTSRLGGAANVIQNLCTLGIASSILSVCGNDDDGSQLLNRLKDSNCCIDGMYVSNARPTTVKTRIIARNQQMVRVDQETTIPLTAEESDYLNHQADKLLAKSQGVIISDYAKGVISQPFIGNLIKKCKAQKKFVAIDPKERHFNLYKGVNIITPNLKEAHMVLGVTQGVSISDEEIKNLGWKIIQKFNLPYLLITLSERGMALFQREGNTFLHLPTMARKVFDVTGAGDTVISVYSAAITSGATPVEAAFIANHAAGLTVAELGTACVTPEALISACLQHENA
jgi:D-beta-D-heptose 7-phosphate kinase/D-beta-D-heptose 1-phosphate adenosyltransferase